MIGKGGGSSVYKFKKGDKYLAKKSMDVKLDSYKSVKKMINFFRRLFRELLIIQKIKLSKSQKLLKYYGFSLKINSI